MPMIPNLGPDPEPEPPIVGSTEQEAIWSGIVNGTGHVVVNALAGTGKTTVLVESMRRMPPGIRTKAGLCAFNKHIAVELERRIPSECRAFTMHSLGYRAIKQAFPQAVVDQGKMDDIMGQACKREEGDELDDARSAVRELTSLCKANLIDGKDVPAIEDLADRHGVAFSADDSDYVMDAIPKVMEMAKSMMLIFDYDDMIWLPTALGLPVRRHEILLVDEAQDLSKCQHSLVAKATAGGRVIVCGDRNQAIYGFRGADTESIDRLKNSLAGSGRIVTEFPLTLTRRCPKAVVRLVNGIVPALRALPDAPEGEVVELTEAGARDFRPGEMVLCRTNAPLATLAHKIAQAGMPVRIIGRDLGKGLASLVRKMRARTIDDLLGNLDEYMMRQAEKLEPQGMRGLRKLAALREKCDFLIALAEPCASIRELDWKIRALFAEPDEGGPACVTLSSIHRAKGMEADRVTIIKSDLIPHPRAKMAWEEVQERNLAYVAVHGYGLHIVNVADPRHPSMVGSAGIEASAALDIAVSGKDAFIAAGLGGVRVFNVTNPRSPVSVGAIDTSGCAFVVAAQGNRVFVADGPGGLLILEKGSIESAPVDNPEMLDSMNAAVAAHMPDPYRSAAPPGTWRATNIPVRARAVPFTAAGAGNLVANDYVVKTTSESGEGSLSWCLENAAAGSTIRFEPSVFPPSHAATIFAPSGLPHLQQGNLTIDGSDAGVIIDGTDAPGNVMGLYVSSSGNIIRGLQIVNFANTGIFLTDSARNNTIGGDRTIGAGPTGQGCVISGNGSGITFFGAGVSGNVVEGNFIGTDAEGMRAMPNSGPGLFVMDSSNNRIGAAASGRSNVIMGNYVGTTASGRAALPNKGDGITVDWEARENFIQANVISGNSGSGVHILSAGNLLRGNRIGIAVSGSAALSNGFDGVRVEGGSNSIGGILPDDGNAIAHNVGAGVRVTAQPANLIRGNSIYENGSGIELDAGGNKGIKSPVLSAVTRSSVAGKTCAGCAVEIFSDSGNQGRVFEGIAVGDGSGNFSFVKVGTLAGPFVTATATDGDGNTSEFSAPKKVP